MAAREVTMARVLRGGQDLITNKKKVGRLQDQIDLENLEAARRRA